MKVLVGCDHAGLELKLKVIQSLPDLHWEDMGTYDSQSTDYPDYADKVCQKLSVIEKENINASREDSRAAEVMGLLICGSGQGMAIRANRFPFIRAALVWNDEIAQLSRQHNNANIICLGARFTSVPEAVRYIQTFLATAFEGGRHQKRVQKLSSDTHC